MSKILIIGNTEYTVSERNMASDGISKTCCRRQYITYKEKKYFLLQFLSELLNEEGIHNKLSLCDIQLPITCSLNNYLCDRGMDCQLISYEEVKSYAEAIPDVIIVYLGDTSNMLPVRRVVNNIKKIFPEVKVILNCPYVYNKWATGKSGEIETAMDTIGADHYLIYSVDYEHLYDIVENIISGEKNIDRIILGKKQVSCREIERAESNYMALSDSAIVYLKTTIGCPARCTFCNFPIKNSIYEVDELSVVEKKLDKIQANGTKYVIFSDDTFNIPVRRFKDICRMIIEKGYTFRWFCYCRLNELDEEGIELLEKAGCLGVYVGIESADDEMFRIMKKGGTVEDYRQKMEFLHKHSILVCAFFLVGFCGETNETVEGNIRFLNESHIDFYTANLWYADVTTPIYSEAELYNLEGKDFNWKHSTMNSSEAAGYTDHIISKVKGPIFVPNEQFGFQGIAYLMYKGYSIEEVKKLLCYSYKMIMNNIDKNFCDEEKTVAEIKKILI